MTTIEIAAFEQYGGKEIKEVEFANYLESVKFVFSHLSDDERLEVMRMACHSCGGLDPSCQCWNDD